MKVTLQSPIAMQSTVPAKLHVAVNSYYQDVEGEYNIRTGVFTPQLVGVYSVEQFCSESGIDQQAFTDRLTYLFKKNIAW